MHCTSMSYTYWKHSFLRNDSKWLVLSSVLHLIIVNMWSVKVQFPCGLAVCHSLEKSIVCLSPQIAC